MNADAHFQIRSAFGTEALIHLGHGQLHREPASHGFVGVVLTRQRRAEDDQDGIADNLINGAVVPSDHVDHGFEINVEKIDHLLRRKPCGLGRETSKV